MGVEPFGQRNRQHAEDPDCEDAQCNFELVWRRSAGTLPTLVAQIFQLAQLAVEIACVFRSARLCHPHICGHSATEPLTYARKIGSCTGGISRATRRIAAASPSVFDCARVKM